MIPEGSSFTDMVALKGKAEIGDRINKKIIAPLVAANQQLLAVSRLMLAEIDSPMQARRSFAFETTLSGGGTCG